MATQDHQPFIAPTYFHVDKARRDAIKNYGGLLTFCYPEGMNISFFQKEDPLAQIDELVTKIGEPVQIVIDFASAIGKTVLAAFPRSDVAEQNINWDLRPVASVFKGGWLPVLSLTQRRIVSSDDFRTTLSFSNDQDFDPLMVVDFGKELSLSRDEVTVRVNDLAVRTELPVFGRGAGEVIYADPFFHFAAAPQGHFLHVPPVSKALDLL